MAEASCCDETTMPDAHRRLDDHLGGLVEEEEVEVETEEEVEAEVEVMEEEEHGPVYAWNNLTSIQSILGHDLMTSSHGHNYSYFSNYDSISLLELYLSKVINPKRRRLSGDPEAAAPTGSLARDFPRNPMFTVQTIAFTFNNKEMMMIEK